MTITKPSEFAVLRERIGWSPQDAAEQLGVSLRSIYRYDRVAPKPNSAEMKLMRYFAGLGRLPTPPKPCPFRFIDLFAGIGGLRKAFEAAGGHCVFTSEWDASARKTYLANFPDDGHQINGDIRDVAPASIPDFEVLVAGFPCQPFSIAGVSKKNALGRPHGFRDATQGTLFFDVARIIEARQPAAFLLENVKNLVGHDGGRTFATIRDTLENELGYTMQYRVLDAKPWVPQHRQRIFIAGFRKDTGFRFDDLPVPSLDGAPKLGAILHGENGTEEAEAPFTEGDDARVADKYTLSTHLWTYLRNYAEKHRAKGNGFGFGLVGPDDVARTLSARYYKDGSEILVKRGEGNPRRLTPRECARLMGFDAPGGTAFRIVVSDTQAYKQFGNSVAVPAATAVAKHMAPHILSVIGQDDAREPELPLYHPVPLAAE